MLWAIHGEGKSVLITWVSQTQRDREKWKSPANKLPHLQTCITVQLPPSPWSTSAALTRRCSWTCLVARSALVRQHSFSPSCPLARLLHCAFFSLQTICFNFWVDLSGVGGHPTGDLSDSSKSCEEMLFMAGKLIGLLPNQRLHP